MAGNYIPRSDTGFQAWVTNFVTYASTNLAGLGIGPGDMIPISTAQTDFDTKMSDNVTAQQAAQSARQAKDASRDTLESLIGRWFGSFRRRAMSMMPSAQRLELTYLIQSKTPLPVGSLQGR